MIHARAHARLRTAAPCALALLFAAACGEEPAYAPDEVADSFVDAPALDVASDTQAIAQEQPGLADILGDDTGCPGQFCGYFQDPNRTYASHAVGMYGWKSCTGAFIGPNIFMTAAHCAGQPVVQFMSYLDNGARHEYGFYCQGTLTQSLEIAGDPAYKGSGDTRLVYCPDINVNGTVLPPGVHFGYLDFDLRLAPLQTQVYQIWNNPVQSLGQHHMLHSAGRITSNTTRYFTPPYQDPIFYTADVCTNQGASGAPSLSADWHRILIGPHAIGGNTQTQSCGVGASGVQAQSLFDKWYIDVSKVPWHMEPNLIASFGLVPGSYDGYQDKNHNYVFDIQQDIEALRGEAARDHYWLGFESRRRNATWSRGPAAVFYTDHLAAPAPPYGILHHDSTQANRIIAKRLPLPSYRAIRIAFQSRRFRGGWLQVRIRHADGTVVSTNAFPDSGAVAKWHRLRMSTGANPVELELYAMGDLKVDLWDLSVIVDGAAMDFDTMDQREGWRNGNTSARAFIVPRGTGSGPDWALAVLRDTSRAVASDWGAINEHLALTPSSRYRFCFQHRSPSGWGSGRVEVMDPTGTYLAGTNFGSTGTWTQTCFEASGVGANSRLRFGDRTATNRHMFYVDDMSITKIN